MDIVNFLLENNNIKKIFALDWSKEYGFTDANNGNIDYSLTNSSDILPSSESCTLIDLIGELSNHQYESPRLSRFDNSVKKMKAVKIMIEIEDEENANNLLDLLAEYGKQILETGKNKKGFKYTHNRKCSIMVKPEFVEDKKELDAVNSRIEDIKTSIEQKLQSLALEYSGFYTPKINNNSTYGTHYQKEGIVMFEKSLEPYVSRYSIDFEETNNGNLDDLLKSKLSLGTKFQIHTPSFWYQQNKIHCINIFVGEHVGLYGMLRTAKLI